MKTNRLSVAVAVICAFVLLAFHFWPHIGRRSSYVEIFNQPTGPYAKATVLYGWPKLFVACEVKVAREHHPFEKPADPIELSDLPWCKHDDIELFSASAFLFNTLAFLSECAILILVIYTIKTRQFSLNLLVIFITFVSIIVALWTQFTDVGIRTYGDALDMTIYWLDDYFYEN